MNKPLGTVRFSLDGKAIDALEGETILQAAKRVGIDIPHLCYKDGYRPDGNCRACVVEIKGERVLAPSCCRAPTPKWPRPRARAGCANSASKAARTRCCPA